MYKSTNGGASWTAFNAGMPSGNIVQSLAIDPSRPTTVYAGTDGGGVFDIEQVFPNYVPIIVKGYSGGW